jgi:tRNA-dihydrouridine synthase
MNFWQKLSKPFFVLAPMADVTDPAFRRIVAEASRHGQPGGGPDVFWTEFVSADGLAFAQRSLGEVGASDLKKHKLLRDLEYTEAERPIVAQLFSSNPENMRAAAKLCAELGFDGIDINMGCPDKTIEKQGAGAAMMKTPDVAVEVIRAAKQGIKDAGKDIPLSVKTRIGYNKNEIETWIPTLLNEDLAALTIHCRTRKELSSVPARWEHVKEVVEIRNKMGKDTVIIGNGDVQDIADANEKAQATGADGVMIGRAIFGNPWLFDKRRISSHPYGGGVARFAAGVVVRMQHFYHRILQKLGFKNRYWLRTSAQVSQKEKLEMLAKHSELFEQLLGDIKSFAIMKKHFKAYVNGFSGAKELRTKLMEEGNDAGSVKKIINNFLLNNQ